MHFKVPSSFSSDNNKKLQQRLYNLMVETKITRFDRNSIDTDN
jgi:hypothetical protein